MNTNLKALTEKVRSEIKAAGIKARVRKFDSDRTIQAFTIEFNVEFTEAEQRTIRTIAVANNLTWVRKQPIVIEQMTNPDVFNFYA